MKHFTKIMSFTSFMIIVVRVDRVIIFYTIIAFHYHSVLEYHFAWSTNNYLMKSMKIISIK
jgi:presenilin-like A22 family membrane protease